jgi:DNA (cytosine-5)-methyltransferase 1
MKKLTIASVFSGVGAFEHALKRLKVKHEIAFACDNGEIETNFDENTAEMLNNIKDNDLLQNKIKELYKNTNEQNFVKETYFNNYKINEQNWYEDIRYLDGTKWKNKVDIFVGGSPCQSFSIMGKRAGLSDARGTLFYDYARLINTIKPKVFIFENVYGMLSHDKGKTWKVIQEVFNSLDYKIHSKVLNSIDFSIPQDRKRLFVVGFKDSNNDFSFPKSFNLETKFNDYLEKKVAVKYFLPKKGFEFVTNPKYKNRARVNPSIMQTQKANQQFNWNGDFVFHTKDEIVKLYGENSNIYIEKFNGISGGIRKLTPRECFNLMGFSKDFKVHQRDVSAYRQAGNSIVVNILEALLHQILEALK